MMIKSILITIALFVGMISNVQAQDEAFKEDALKLTKMASGAVDANLGQIYTMIPEDKVEDFKKELKPIMEGFYTKLAMKSMEYYTHDEVKELLSFYDTEIGKKSLEVQSKMTKESMGMAQELSMKLMPLVQKYTQ